MSVVTVIWENLHAKHAVKNVLGLPWKCLIRLHQINKLRNGEKIVFSEAHGEVLVKLELKLHFFLYIAQNELKREMVEGRDGIIIGNCTQTLIRIITIFLC